MVDISCIRTETLLELINEWWEEITITKTNDPRVPAFGKRLKEIFHYTEMEFEYDMANSKWRLKNEKY